MRTKLLRGREDVTVQLVYPSTLDEYRQALDVLGGSAPVVGSGDLDSVPTGSKPGHAAYMVTTAQQRRRWGRPDLAVSGRGVPVNEARALDLLYLAAANPDAGVELFPGRSAEVGSGQDAGASGGLWFDAVHGFLSPGVRVEQAVGALDGAGLPSAVQEALSNGLTQVLGPGAKLAEAELDRVRHQGEGARCESAGVDQRGPVSREREALRAGRCRRCPAPDHGALRTAGRRSSCLFFRWRTVRPLCPTCVPPEGVGTSFPRGWGRALRGGPGDYSEVIRLRPAGR